MQEVSGPPPAATGGRGLTRILSGAEPGARCSHGDGEEPEDGDGGMETGDAVPVQARTDGSPSPC